MTDYVISYDICAFMLMIVFSAYYYSSKRFESSSNNMFNVLVWLVIGSITFDLMGVTTITFSDFFPVWLNYTVNIIYFLVTGLMSSAFCLYTVSRTRSYIGGKTFWFYFFFFLPFDLMAIVIASTPLTKLVFYFDENHDYQHGPLMNVLLVVVVLYLLFSMVRVTFFHDDISIAKRMPFYTFAILMLSSIAIQAYYGIYLMYGIAEALGILVLYITNHNPNDLVDTTSGLFNRKAFFTKLDQLILEESEFSIVAFGIKNSEDESSDFDSEFKLYLAEQIGAKLNNMFNDKNVYYIDDDCYAIILDQNTGTNTKYTETRIKLLFENPWKHYNSKKIVRIGMSRLYVPKDAKQPSVIYELLHAAIRLSNRISGKTIAASDVRDEREKKIYALENEQKLLEEKYHEADLQMQQAVKADRSKSLFLAQMSHEIRTPMTAILGMTELVLRDTSDPRIIEHANAIMASGKSLLGIINDILDFSKIEAGKLEILEETYYIHSIVYDVINSVEQRISDKRLHLKVHLDPHIPAAMFGDEIRIKQIIINFLTNACKYTEKGTIELELYMENKGSDKGTLCCSVKDTGIGIRKEDIPKLFEGFQRFDSQRNKSIEGTGLGLAICKMLVESMGGEILVESEYGVGSTFTFKIPQKIVDGKDTITIENAEKYNFLVLCDNLMQRDDFDRCFADFNIPVTFTDSIQEFYANCHGAEGDKYSHLVISYSQYDELFSTGSSILNDSRLVVALNYRHYMADMKGQLTFHLPLCSLNLLHLLEGEQVVDSSKPKLDYLNYIAPDVKLLVVDDNLVNLKIFTGLLECHKMQIDCADSGDKAIALAREKKYHMIFLDHMMPKKDGIETLHEIKQERNAINASTPFIAFTANAVSGMKEMFMEQGFNDFLSKPINIAKMEAMLRDFLPVELLIPTNISETETDIPGSAQNSGQNDNDSFTVPGLNMAHALEYAGDNYGTLKMVLETLVTEGKAKLDILADSIKNGDYDNYQIEIHAVKSLCKSIGADELSEKARLLEFACKSKDFDYVNNYCDEAYREYSELLDTVDKALKDINGSKAQVNTSEGGGTLSLNYKDQLICMLALLHEFEEDLSVRLADDLALHKSELPDAVAEAIDKIKNCLNMYDYDGAANLITEVLNEN